MLKWLICGTQEFSLIDTNTLAIYYRTFLFEKEVLNREKFAPTGLASELEFPR